MITSQHLLAVVWGSAEGWVFMPVKAPDGTWRERPPIRWPIPEQDIEIPSDSDEVYFCPTVFSEPKRRAEHAQPTRFLWSDLDAADPRKTRARPSIAWETTGGVSPHYQGLWLLDREVPAARAANLSRRIAYAEGADKGGWDVTQVLRIPGTLNHKHDPPHRVRLLWAKALIHTLDDIKGVYPSVPAPVEKVTCWPDVSDQQIATAVSNLPYGIKRMLSINPDRVDRSLTLQLIARHLARWNVPADVAAHILRRASVNKFAGRSDEKQRLLSEVEKGRLSMLLTTGDYPAQDAP